MAVPARLMWEHPRRLQPSLPVPTLGPSLPQDSCTFPAAQHLAAHTPFLIPQKWILDLPNYASRKLHWVRFPLPPAPQGRFLGRSELLSQTHWAPLTTWHIHLWSLTTHTCTQVTWPFHCILFASYFQLISLSILPMDGTHNCPFLVPLLKPWKHFLGTEGRGRETNYTHVSFHPTQQSKVFNKKV